MICEWGDMRPPSPPPLKPLLVFMMGAVYTK